MNKKVKNIFLLLLTLFFFYLISHYYFSESNIKKVNKLRLTNLFINLENLPLLKNDTLNIIEYKDDAQNFIGNKKKYTFEELIKNDK